MIMNKSHFDLQNPRGMAALFTIVIIASAGILLALGSTMIGIGSLEAGYADQKGGAALSLADGCAEETMRRIRFQPSYTSTNQILSLQGGSCTINVTDNPPSGASKRIEVVGTFEDFNRKIRIDLNLSADPVTLVNNILSVYSWEERSD